MLPFQYWSESLTISLYLCFSPAVWLLIISAARTLCRHPYRRWRRDHSSLIKYVYLPLIRRYSFASTTPPPPSPCSDFTLNLLYVELLTGLKGLKQIDCQHSSQGPSIRLSLSAAHTPEAMKHFALLVLHTLLLCPSKEAAPSPSTALSLSFYCSSCPFVQVQYFQYVFLWCSVR